MRKTRWTVTLALSSVLILFACGKHGGTPGVGGGSGHLYVTDNPTTATPAQLLVYALPLSAASTPSVTVPIGTLATTLADVKLDTAGAIYVADFSENKILAFASPLTSTSTPAYAITTGILQPTGIAFDSAGRMYVSNSPLTGGDIQVYSPPFSATSAPTQTITTGLHGPQELAFDSTGNLYVANLAGGSSGNGSITMFLPPYSAAPTIVTQAGNPSGVALDTTSHLYVGNINGDLEIKQYATPLTTASTPLLSLVPSATNRPQALTFDSVGRLIGADSDTLVPSAALDVFVPPFSDLQGPAFSVTAGLNSGNLGGIVAGR